MAIVPATPKLLDEPEAFRDATVLPHIEAMHNMYLQLPIIAKVGL